MTDPIVIVAHRDPETGEALRERLAAGGCHVLGPTARAGIALALAAQSPAAFAVIGEELAGRRDGRTLAEALERSWGIPSLVLPTPVA
jgi:hypothetical protein